MIELGVLNKVLGKEFTPRVEGCRKTHLELFAKLFEREFGKRYNICDRLIDGLISRFINRLI